MNDFAMKRIFLFLIVFLSCFGILYVMGAKTYTAFESEVTGNSSANIATWNIFINEKQLHQFTEQDLLIDDITWDTQHTRDGKVSPGSTGTMKLVIDPSTTDVAIRYDITYEDRSSNEEYLLHVLSIEDGENELIRTGPNTYTGIFTLDDIKNGKQKTIDISLVWKNEEAQNEEDTMVGDGTKQPNYVKFYFEASQYQGEVIEEYVE